ncbi:hypothetical protein BV25DRAFT_1835351 [Artomyces pyxidatus]|uniref:Uncharacterized protein n=1 Tax=Artomyces pyxidatus TaxID=48021 RepID=A0ACB8TF02_9AGAM|nr:hypothetical protein BV25DRAFT_1835351 [Artomyces pyxidatus]
MSEASLLLELHLASGRRVEHIFIHFQKFESWSSNYTRLGRIMHHLNSCIEVECTHGSIKTTSDSSLGDSVSKTKGRQFLRGTIPLAARDFLETEGQRLQCSVNSDVLRHFSADGTPKQTASGAGPRCCEIKGGVRKEGHPITIAPSLPDHRSMGPEMYMEISFRIYISVAVRRLVLGKVNVCSRKSNTGSGAVRPGASVYVVAEATGKGRYSHEDNTVDAPIQATALGRMQRWITVKVQYTPYLHRAAGPVCPVIRLCADKTRRDRKRSEDADHASIHDIQCGTIFKELKKISTSKDAEIRPPD